MPKLILIMGVSGSGKTTMMETSGIFDDDRFENVPSYTTRKKRPDEIDGERYFFVDDAEFQGAIMAGEFLEYEMIHQLYFSGTKLDSVQEVIDAGKNPVKQVDTKGLVQIKQITSLPFGVFSVFLDIPNSVMIERINQRGQLSAVELGNRIQSAELEREQAQTYCDVIIDATQPLEKVIETFIHTINTAVE